MALSSPLTYAIRPELGKDYDLDTLEVSFQSVESELGNKFDRRGDLVLERGKSLVLTDSTGAASYTLSINASGQLVLVNYSDGTNPTFLVDFDEVNGAQTYIDTADGTLQTNIDTNAAAIVTEAGIRATADTNLQAIFTANGMTTGTNFGSSITTNSTAIASANSSIATLQTDVAANASGISTNASGISTNATAISDESSARATADTNLQAIFTANQLTVSTDVVADVATNASAISTNASGIASLTTTVSSNTTAASNAQSTADTAVTNAATAQSAADAAQADADTNATNIATNTANITTNASAITTANSSIATLQTDVSANTTSISTNSGNITTNTSDITGLDGRLTTAEGSITTAQADISTNATAITDEASARATEASLIQAQVDSITQSFTIEYITLDDTRITLDGVDITINSGEFGVNVGDLRVDQTNNNALERWDGDSWEDAADSRIGTNAASITNISEAYATDSSATARILWEVNTSTNAASLVASAATGYNDGTWNGSAIKLSADLIELVAKAINFGSDTTFEDTHDTLYVEQNSHRMRLLGPFGTSSDLMLWMGPTSVSLNSETDANGFFALKNDGSIYLRSATSGERVTIDDGEISVYDSGGTRRVRLGVWT